MCERPRARTRGSRGRSCPTSSSGRSLLRVHYLSLHEASGYAIAAQRCMLALAESGLALRWIPFTQGLSWGLGYQPTLLEEHDDPQLEALLDGPSEADVVVAHLVPEYYPIVRALYPPPVRLVGHTVWETDRLPQHWPALLECLDALVVPCRWNAEVFAASGLGAPIHVVPHVGEAPARVEHETWSQIDPQRTVFYTISTWTARKALPSTIRAYLSAFTADDPVELVIKTQQHDISRPWPRDGVGSGPGTTAWALARIVREFASPAPIRLVTGDVSETEIAALHTRGDCYVSLCHSEGWGVPAFDAAAVGNPVVITGYGGQLDYLEAAHGLLVDYRLVPVDDPVGWSSFTPDQRWAEPSIAHAARLLRDVHERRELHAARAAAAAPRLLERFAPDRIAAAMRPALAREAG